LIFHRIQSRLPDSAFSLAQAMISLPHKHYDFNSLSSHHNLISGGAFQYHRRMASTREQISKL
jgi:hypothetical protein